MLLTDDLEKTLKKAYQEAKARHHEFVTLEHLLYALTQDPIAGDAMSRCGVDLKRLKSDLDRFFSEELASLKMADTNLEPQYTIGVQIVLQLAATHVQSAGKQRMDGGDVLAAMFHEKESHAIYYLARQQVTRFDVMRYLSHGVGRTSSHPLVETDDETGMPAKDPLKKFCVNLNERAKKGSIDPLIGRQKELERTIHILSRRRKNNPIFVGDAGVGKTAIAEGLALEITKGRVPSGLKDAVVFALDMAGLVAGTKFRGEFEDRLKNVIEAAKNHKNAVLFVDEIHTIIGAGAVAGGSLDASNLLKPALANGDIKCIGTTTHKEYRTIFEKDHALSRRFQKIDVGEPTLAECVEILKGLKKHYEDFHKVTYSNAALQSAADLASRYINDRQLPDKAIDVMDEAGAEVKLRSKRVGPGRVTPRDIENIVSRIAGVPTHTVKADDRTRLEVLERDIKVKIFGQDEAVDQVVKAIRMSRAGLSEIDKPIGSFLFAGPTGVGKTELAKQLAQTLGIGFTRFDMSEYMEKHTVSRLIGSPPGYVGFEQGGLLTEAIHRAPHTVLLLDEIEKAHEDIFNILLQVMDHATLTDNNGRKSDFRQVILIMTTNMGARDSMVRNIGFGKAEFDDKSSKAIEKAFSPEFRNRLTATVRFNPLDRPIVLQIVDKMLDGLKDRLSAKRVTVQVTDEARNYLADRGFDPQFGARPIKRVIDQEIAQPLSEQILFGKLLDGGEVVVTLKDGILVFE